MRVYGLAQIKREYTQKREWEKQFPINCFLVRPISFYLTYLALKITRNPAKVAIFGFILGILGCMLLSCSSLLTIWPGYILVVLYSISDAVDGNIARTTKNVTLFGKYLDGIFGEIIDGMYFFCIGIGLFFTKSGQNGSIALPWLGQHIQTFPLFLGALILICKLWGNAFRDRYEIYKIKKEGLAPYDKSKNDRVIGKSKYANRWYYLTYINLDCLNNQLLLLFVFAAMDLQTWFLMLYASFFVVKSLFFFIFFFWKAKSKLTQNITFLIDS